MARFIGSLRVFDPVNLIHLRGFVDRVQVLKVQVRRGDHPAKHPRPRAPFVIRKHAQIFRREHPDCIRQAFRYDGWKCQQVIPLAVGFRLQADELRSVRYQLADFRIPVRREAHIVLSPAMYFTVSREQPRVALVNQAIPAAIHYDREACESVEITTAKRIDAGFVDHDDVFNVLRRVAVIRNTLKGHPPRRGEIVRYARCRMNNRELHSKAPIFITSEPSPENDRGEPSASPETFHQFRNSHRPPT